MVCVVPALAAAPLVSGLHDEHSDSSWFIQKCGEAGTSMYRLSIALPLRLSAEIDDNHADDQSTTKAAKEHEVMQQPIRWQSQVETIINTVGRFPISARLSSAIDPATNVANAISRRCQRADLSRFPSVQAADGFQHGINLARLTLAAVRSDRSAAISRGVAEGKLLAPVFTPGLREQS